MTFFPTYFHLNTTLILLLPNKYKLNQDIVPLVSLKAIILIEG